MSIKKSLVDLTGTTRSTSHRWIILVAVFLLAGSTACGQAAPTATPTPRPTNTPAATLQPEETTRTLQVGDLQRTYILHIPPSLDSSQAQPLVFVFHGYPGTATDIQARTGFNAISDKNGFILVYPNGVEGDWNLAIPSYGAKADDLTFLRQIIADLGSTARVDPKRIYAVGPSGGGFFTYRLACEMSDTFAAIAAVEATMLTQSCRPSQPVSVLHVHGSTDQVVPYLGSTSRPGVNGTLDEVVWPPVEQTIATWVKLDGCNSTAQVETLQNGAVTHTVYSGCQAGTAVELYLIKSGGHEWMDTYHFSSINSQTLWDFFKAHPKP